MSEEESRLGELLVKCPNTFIMKQRVANLMLFIRYLRDRNAEATKATPNDLNRAETMIVRFIQGQEYAEEIDALSKGKRIPKSSWIRRLSPILDDDGVLRIGTRLVQGDLP